MSGGSSSTQTTSLSPWMEEAAKAQLGKATALTDIEQNPYKQYEGQRIADFSDLQKKSFANIENLGTSGAIGQGIDVAGQAAQRALNTSYDPAQAQNQYQGFDPYQSRQFQNQFQAPGQYQAGQFGADRVQAQGLQNYQMGPAERVRTQSFAMPGAAEAYMSPYMQNVVDTQQREARRASDIQRNQSQAQAVGQGAFGGSRQAIIEAERQRNLGTQLGDIQATGSQAAYQQAQQQFNAEQAARLQAQQANQQAGLTVGQQNLGANLGIQQLASGQNLQAQLANQQQALEAQRLAEQSRQFGAGQGLSAAQLQAQYGLSAQQAEEASRQFASSQAARDAEQRAQYGQSAQQLAEQSRQFGAGQGLQGLQTALSGASQLGGLGSTQFGQQKDIIGAQQTAGALQQAQNQAGLSQSYEDFLNKQKYPYQQLEFMSNIMRGTPYGSTTSLYNSGPSLGSTLLGAGTSLAGAALLGGKGIPFFSKEGGVVKSYAVGGKVSDAKVKKKKTSGLAELALSKI